jgi:hypothetical protein
MSFFAANVIPHWTWDRFEYIFVIGVFVMLFEVVFFLLINKIFNTQPSNTLLNTGV